MRYRSHTRPAPRRPKLQHHDLALEGGPFHFLSLRRLEHFLQAKRGRGIANFWLGLVALRENRQNPGGHHHQRKQNLFHIFWLNGSPHLLPLSETPVASGGFGLVEFAFSS